MSQGKAVSGDRPIGATSCRPKHTVASCHPPPPPHPRALGPTTARLSWNTHLKLGLPSAGSWYNKQRKGIFTSSPSMGLGGPNTGGT